MRLGAREGPRLPLHQAVHTLEHREPGGNFSRTLGTMSRKEEKVLRKQKEKRAKANARNRLARGSAGTAPPTKRDESPRRDLTENRRFNRRESATDHYYYGDYGTKGVGNAEYNGWIKCRLLHGHGYSLIVPDQLYLESNGLRWIQPLAFGPSILTKLSDTEVVCDLNVDVSCGHRLEVRFFNRDHVADLVDGSQLFRCRIKGVANLPSFATGDARWGSARRPYLRLFHHTTGSTVPLILNSGHFRTGAWNIQGSSKQLKNVAYAYFTPLDAIRTGGDLKRIGMSIEGTIELRRDGFTPPRVLMPDYLKTFKDDILQLQVYQCDPAKREARIELWIDAAVLAPQHVYRHDEGLGVYYELPHPFIHRVGTEPGQPLAFDADRSIHDQKGLKRFDYAVVGDCTTLAGLAAPYDEEDTTLVLKVERIAAGTTMLDFWFGRGNTDLFSGKKMELQEFQPPKESGGSA